MILILLFYYYIHIILIGNIHKWLVDRIVIRGNHKDSLSLSFSPYLSFICINRFVCSHQCPNWVASQRIFNSLFSFLSGLGPAWATFRFWRTHTLWFLSFLNAIPCRHVPTLHWLLLLLWMDQWHSGFRYRFSPQIIFFSLHPASLSLSLLLFVRVAFFLLVIAIQCCPRLLFFRFTNWIKF